MADVGRRHSRGRAIGRRIGDRSGGRLLPRIRAVAIALLLALTLLVGANGPLTSGIGLGTSVVTAHAAGQSTTDIPNLFDPRSAAGRALVPQPPSPPAGTSTASAPQAIQRGLPVTMAPATVPLTPGTAAHFQGSDGRLQLDVPSGAVTPADLTAAGGQLGVRITQIAPASGSNAGGTGRVSLGTYLLQVVDGQGRLVPRALRKPITLRLHVGKHSAVDLSHAFVVWNGSLPAGTSLAPLSPAMVSAVRGLDAGHVGIPAPTAAASGFGTFGSQSATIDPATGSLVVQPLISTPSSSLSFNTDGAVASFGKPDPFNVNLNAGALTAGIPIDVPAGPGGLTPPVNLSYSSESVAEQHSPQAAAGWVGEGWNLSLGSISWAEHNVTTSCISTCGSTWEDSWQLSDPFGTAAELIPPNINYATFWDDSPYFGCDTGTTGITPTHACPVTWHTAPETHARVIQYTGTIVPAGQPGAHAPCFRVFLPSGIMEEFGCTSDSLQYYFVPGSGSYIANWFLDLITDPKGNQIHITYRQDIAQKTDTDPNHTVYNYPRDTQLATIEYDSPSCRNAQTACSPSGTAPNLWAPLVRVNFVASNVPARRTGTAPTGCNSGTNLRCDDPLDLTGSSGLAAPEVQNTFVLNELQVQVRSNTSTAWSSAPILKDYQLSYQQTAPSQINDPATGKPESVAGQLLLTQLKVVGDDVGTTNTALPVQAFTYTQVTEYYEDDLFSPNPPPGSTTPICGPAWNTGHGNGCLLWSQSYAGNSFYLASSDNGMGLHQTFAWANARSNTHGVNGLGTNNANPLYCNGLSATAQATYPCNEVDDEAWSHVVLTSRTGTVLRAASPSNVTVTSTSSYIYKLTTPLSAQECADCVAGMYWGNQNDGDYLDFYNGKFMGFTETDVTNPNNSVEFHKFYATLGWGIYDTAQVGCFTAMQPLTNPPSCHNSPWWNLTNAAHGHEIEADFFDTNGTTLLKKVTHQYSATCPPSGVAGTPAWTGTPNYGNWNGNLVSELDHNNPVAACDVQMTQTIESTVDGSTTASSTHQTTYSYDSYGRQTQATDQTSGGSPWQIVHKTSYVQDDAVSATSTSATGHYLIDFPAFTDTEDTSGNRYTCSYTGYDGQAYTTGQTSLLTLGEATTQDKYTNCGTSPGFTPSGLIRTTSTYDLYGNVVATNDPDSNAGASAHLGCTVSSVQHSICNTYDGTFETLLLSTADAMNQAESTGYGNATAPGLGGFGLWPTSTTDKNGQVTSYGYDALGRMTSETLPGEGTGLTTKSWVYTAWCATTGAQAPCVELDETQRLDSATTVTTRAFYDGYGRLIETRAPAPGGNDVVRYRNYDPSGHVVFDSIKYFVPAYTGAAGSAAFSTPDATQPGTTTTYDGLGRVLTSTDALSHTTSTSYSVQTGTFGAHGSNTDEVTTVVDALGHKIDTWVDGLGRTNIVRHYSGNSPGTYALYAQTQYWYTYQGPLAQIVHPDGTTTTTFSYDAAGRKTGLNDPDRGAEAYAYDTNGNVTQTVDARGAAGTVYTGYDAIDRQLWRNTTNSATGAYVTYSYDSTLGGNMGVGHLTGETFTGGPGNTLSGTYSLAYDQRGRPISKTVTIGGTSYTSQQSYDDAGNVLTQTYPDGEVVTNAYTPQAWVAGLTVQQGSVSTPVVNAVTYSGVGGAGGVITGASLGGTYTYAASYDSLLRLTDTTITVSSTGTKLFEEARGFDAAGNVTSLNTTLPQGTDVQQFCYDEQNRLTWAGAAGTPPCTGVAISSGTLTASQYTQSFAYDTFGRLTSGPLGNYTYGDGAHLHAVTAIGTAYTAAYDAAGDMVCRAPSSGTTCAGTGATGAQLSYDAEGRLVAWQDAPTTPSTTDANLYDGDGQRVVQQVTQGGATTTTVYLDNLEQVTTSGTTTTTTAYYYVGALRIAEAVNGTFSYLATNALGSTSLALDASGNAEASTLYTPYGAVRYTSGSMPTDYGFTGQHSDAATGLDYYNARYYDPLAGQFTSADVALPAGGYDLWGLSRYAYVEGNPIARTDPSGHRFVSSAGSPLDTALQNINYTGIATSLAEGQKGLRAAYYHYKVEQAQRTFEDEKAAWRKANGSGDIPRYVRRRLTRARSLAARAAEDSESLAEGEAAATHDLGTALMVVGGVLDGAATFKREWDADEQYGTGMRFLRATTAGVVHGALSAGVAYGGAVVGETIGTVAGTVIGAVAFGAVGFLIGGPVGAAIGLDIGAEVGGIVGGTAGGIAGALWASDHFASATDTAAATVTEAVTNVANGVGNLAGNVGNAIGSLGSLFG